MIHYHGTPCGGQREQAARFVRGRHVLIPWPRPEDLDFAIEFGASFMLDNGAFTAWKQGEPITNWRPYYEWVSGLYTCPGFDGAVIPDVIDGDEDANNKLLIEWHRNVCPSIQGWPVWHMHESYERLRWLCDTHGSKRVCIGSSGQFATIGTDKWHERMQGAMRAICINGKPRCKIHGLRMLDPNIFGMYPFASADSTNAVRNACSYSRFGMYKSPHSAARAATIADIIEFQQSPPMWIEPSEQQGDLFNDAV